MSPEEIQALPERAQRYIHHLETRSDPAGDIAALWCARETAEALALRVRELEADLALRR
jgi:hypothetical protein